MNWTRHLGSLGRQKYMPIYCDGYNILRMHSYTFLQRFNFYEIFTEYVAGNAATVKRLNRTYYYNRSNVPSKNVLSHYIVINV